LKKVIVFLFLLLAFWPAQAHCEQPLEVLRGAIDHVISILEDPALRDETRKESQHKKIWDAIKQIFDFEEMSKRTLARNWKRFTQQQKEEFTDTFGEFLADNYLRKIQKDFKAEKVIYLNQDMVTDTKALVKTKILRKAVEIPVDYGMLIRDKSWRVYDVKIEGVSLMKNYRAQFQNILIKESPSQLIERLKKKIQAQG